MRTALSLVLLALLASVGCGGGRSSGGTPQSNFVFAPASGATLPPATTAAAYAETFSVLSGGKPPYTFTPLSIPQGLTLTPVTTTGTDAQLTGTPTQMGTQKVSFQVVDSTNQNVGIATYQLPVN